MPLFDSHAHLQFPHYDHDRNELIKKLKSADIRVINVGTDFNDSQKAVDFAQKYQGLMWASVGLHPNGTLGKDFDFEKFRVLARASSVVAVGECGLDYSKSPDILDKERQGRIFAEQIRLAQELKKPLIIHGRPKVDDDAYSDILKILEEENFSGGGVAHFFVGSQEIAQKFLALSFDIAFSGVITFAEEYKKLVEAVPLDRILIETDSPFAAPAPHRGKRNEPAFVEWVARKIAEWQGLDYGIVANETYKNACRLFKIGMTA